MIGNSLKLEDVILLIEIGTAAIHVPFYTTWVHKEIKEEQRLDAYKTMPSITDVLKFL
ncbi:HAD family hydrolase [Tenacibaculum sediminilitoris]|uniref:hypothetical protein n=1 Tax=Tenacibaculum sediminilitoris TaxID=1820334 RepID=UPI0038B49946